MLEEITVAQDWQESASFKILRLPNKVIAQLESEQPLLANFFVTNTGFFTKVRGHHTVRKTFDENIVIYCLDGRGWYEAAGQRWQVGRGQALFVQQDVPHAYGSDSSDPWSIQWAHFRGAQASEYLQLLGIRPDKPIATIGIHTSITFLFQEALEMMRSGYSVHHLVKTAAVVQQILSQIALLDAYTPPPGSTALNVEAVINFMLANIHRRCSLDDFAAEAMLSRSYFSRQFREKTGYAPVDYFIRLKVQRACELLETTLMPVGEVALTLGYDDQYYFSRIFKKIVGAHPTAYRRMCEADHPGRTALVRLEATPA
ncbi:MAG: AraC family transcriptional regulator [Caldilineales bacterium]|nr:AraC family transcriptional regulator [Caldilineales bacterium]